MNQIWGSMEQYSTVVWHWPIALYLFLAGLSAGAIMTSLAVKWIKGNESPPWDGLIKAGALIAPIAICAGLLLLVVDLTRPLYFWKLLIHYNLASVMSLGVIALLVYTPLSFIYAAIKFKHLSILKPLRSLIDRVGDSPRWLERLLVVFSVIIAAYTGFLLSAIYHYPLLNTPMLPLLFLASSLSAGIAGAILVGLLFFRPQVNESNARFLLMLDLRVIVMELLLLVILFIGLYFQGADKAAVAVQALTAGGWAWFFWLGVVALGIMTPLTVAMTALRHHDYKVGYILFNATATMVGVVLLRIYILYAGQLMLG